MLLLKMSYVKENHLNLPVVLCRGHCNSQERVGMQWLMLKTSAGIIFKLQIKKFVNDGEKIVLYEFFD